jgi:hypothetical protein
MMNRIFGLFKRKQPEKEIHTHPLIDIVIDGMEQRATENESKHEPLALTDFADVRSSYYGVSGEGNLEIHLPGYNLTQQHYKQQLNANLIFFQDHETFQQEAPGLLASFKKQGKNYRHGIVVIHDEAQTNHTIPYIYLKENGSEGLLIADSLGVENTQAARIHELTKMDLFCIKIPRQASSFGCDVDAAILCRDSTSYLGNNQYYIPDLLTKIKSRSTLFMTIDNSNLYEAKLPDKLLTTAETSHFVAVNRETIPDKVYDFDSLDAFRKYYYAYDPLLKKNVNKFVEDSGWLMADTIEIQFYLNQLQDLLGDKLTTEFRALFTKEASLILQKQGLIHEYFDTKLQKNALGKDEIIILRPSLHTHLSGLLKQCLTDNSNVNKNTFRNI